jgi:hypothetical protein
MSSSAPRRHRTVRTRERHERAVGVQVGRLCPGAGARTASPGARGCGRGRRASRPTGLVALGACLVTEDVIEFVCRARPGSSGHEDDPTPDEQSLTEPLGVSHATSSGLLVTTGDGRGVGQRRAGAGSPSASRARGSFSSVRELHGEQTSWSEGRSPAWTASGAVPTEVAFQLSWSVRPVLAATGRWCRGEPHRHGCQRWLTGCPGWTRVGRVVP